MSTERIIVHSSIVESFRQKLEAQVNRVFGTTETIPVIITAASAKRNRGLIEDAVSHGASIVNHGTAIDQSGWPETKIRPTIISGVDPKMQLYKTESFGPSVSLYTYETEEEAIEFANNTDYGLSAGVWSENLGAAFRVADKLDSGAVHINSMTVHDEFALPHGGVKSSGFGRFNGYQGLEEFLYCKTVTWME